MANEIQQFFRDHGISEVEAIIPDMAGIARGKIMPAEKFAEDEGMRLPESIFLQTVTGDYPPDTGTAMSPAEIDIVLKADPKTVRARALGGRADRAGHPRLLLLGRPARRRWRRASVLRNVLELYAQRGWEPVVAPELEFYLVEPNIDADYPLKPPVGRSGRAEPGRQSLQHRRGQRVRSAVRRHLPVLRGPGHRDRHADPRGRRRRRWRSTCCTATRWISPTRCSCSSAPRARRRCATRCTPPSWPSRTPRSRAAPCTSTRASSTPRRRKTSSAIADGTPSPLFFSHIAGLQKYLPAAMALFAPNVNSYRRIARYQLGARSTSSGATTTAPRPARAGVGRRGAPRREPRRRRRRQPLYRHRRLAGLRLSRHGRGPAAERADHRQRARSAVLACRARSTMRCATLRECEPLVESCWRALRCRPTPRQGAEYEVFLQVISSWEREHLLLNV